MVLENMLHFNDAPPYVAEKRLASKFCVSRSASASLAQDARDGAFRVLVVADFPWLRILTAFVRRSPYAYLYKDGRCRQEGNVLASLPFTSPQQSNTLHEYTCVCGCIFV